jgi:hypothetical protein
VREWSVVEGGLAGKEGCPRNYFLLPAPLSNKKQRFTMRRSLAHGSKKTA